LKHAASMRDNKRSQFEEQIRTLSDLEEEDDLTVDEDKAKTIIKEPSSASLHSDDKVPEESQVNAFKQSKVFNKKNFSPQL
jgi:hypothetical protein